jgi:hypothetical protein
VSDIAPIKGLIELTDNFTSELGLAEAALGNFTKTNQESLKAVSIAAGLVAGGITAIGVAALELGKRGSEINDVNTTLEHFAGGTKEAKADLDALVAGTKGTVDNFQLASDAAKLLQANVRLTADDFGILGQAAFVLQNRGLGGTKEQLDLVSDALVTGKTKALAHTLGVIENTQAEEQYAEKLGITKDQLSATGLAEAHRIEVMRILNAAVKDAGVQNRDFGEELQFAKTQVTNFVDDLASAVASSKVFAAGFKAIEDAVASAFEGSQENAIKTVVHALEQGAITVLDFGQTAITMARVFEGAWYGIKTVILGVETTVVGFAAAAVDAIDLVASAGAKLHIISPEAAKAVSDVSVQINAMTADLAKQTLEAGKAVVGHTEFDKTLDGLSESLAKVTGSMRSASEETDKNSDTTDIASKNAAKLKQTQDELNKSMIDQSKITAALVKSTTELNGIWSDYFALVSKNTQTSGQAQRAEIQATFDKQVAALDALDPLYNAKYDAYRKIADESLKAVGSDWDSVKDQSIEGLQEQADKAEKTYDQMVNSSLHFTRDALDAQRDKWIAAQQAANGWSTSVKQAIQDTADKVKILDHAWVDDADIAAATINKTTIMVKTLSGELISLAEAQKRQQAGGTQDVTSLNFAQMLTQIITSGGWNPSGAGSNIDVNKAYDLAHQGYSFAEIISIFNQMKTSTGNPKLPPPQGPRIPGFAQGGTVAVRLGENGPETVRIPIGSQVAPNGTSFGGGPTIVLTFNVNGTGVQVAQQIKDVIMRQLKQVRQFGAA